MIFVKSDKAIKIRACRFFLLSNSIIRFFGFVVGFFRLCGEIHILQLTYARWRIRWENKAKIA